MEKIVEIRTQIATTQIETPVGKGGARWVDNLFVHVETESGVVGSSYVYRVSPRLEAELPPNAVIRIPETAVRSLAPMLIGHDVFAYERFWEQVRNFSYQAGYGPITLAQSALDMATWDAKCKLLDMPLYRVLGASRDRVPCYCNDLIHYAGAPPDEVGEQALRLVGEGYRALKMPILPRVGEHWTMPLERVRAVRDAVGPEVDLMVDAGGAYSVSQLLRIATRIDDLELRWLEDPIDLAHVDRLETVRNVLRTPIATGETSFSHGLLRNILEQNLTDVLLFEPMRVGGITGAIKVAAVAEAHGVGVAAHTYAELAGQLMAALPNGELCEYLSWWEPLFNSRLVVEDGWAIPSERPGVGWDFDQELLEGLEVTRISSASTPGA